MTLPATAHALRCSRTSSLGEAVVSTTSSPCQSASSLRSLHSTPTRNLSSSLRSSSWSNLRPLADTTAAAAKAATISILSRLAFLDSDSASGALVPPLIFDKDGVTLVQWIVIFAMALQLPSCLTQFFEIFELHIHGFPLLVVLGTLPYFRRHQQRAMTVATPGSAASTGSFAVESLTRIESYYRYHQQAAEHHHERPPTRAWEEPLLSPPRIRRVASSASAGSLHHHESNNTDEWGHFADFDEVVRDSDAILPLPVSS